MMSGEALDHRRLLAEIEDEVRRRRESGDLPPHLERELDMVFARYAPVHAIDGDFAQVLERAQQATFVDVLAPVASSRPGVPFVKRVVRKVVLWIVRYVAQQVSGFAEAITRAVELLGRRVDDLEQAVGTRSTPAFGDPAPMPDPDHWGPVLVDVLADGRGPGRVLHAECGDGALVRALVDKGVDAYGVGPTPVDDTDLDLRVDGVVEHLGKVPEGALAGIVLSGCVDRFPTAARFRLADAAVARLAPGGMLVVVGTHPVVWERERSPVELDLGGGRPFHAPTWAHLLAERGLEVTAVHDGPRHETLDSAIPDLERLDALLFPAASYAVVAARPR